MSYDIELKMDTGAKDLTTVIDVGNYTSNIVKMFNHVFEVEDWKYIDGMLASAVLPILRRAHACMVLSEDYLKTLNPENGWGNYEGALKFLKKMIDACEEHPKTIFKIDY